MSFPVAQHLVTLDQATKIIRFFKKKQHRDKGYFFELQDLGAPMRDALRLPGLEPYSVKGSLVTKLHPWFNENAYILRVHRDAPAR